MENPTSHAVAISRKPSSKSLTAELAPVGQVEIKPMLAKLSLACRSNQGDDIDWRARAALYVQYLSDLPAKCLSEAIDEWIREQVFFPAIAELRNIAERRAANARQRLRELREAERKRADEEKWARLQRPTAEEMREIRARIEGGACLRKVSA